MLPIKKGKIRTKTQNGISNENTHVKSSIQILQFWSCKRSYGLIDVLRRNYFIGVDIDDFDRSSVITVGLSVTNEVPNVVRKVEQPGVSRS